MEPIAAPPFSQWPNVPHCYGWLGLGNRGDWYMRDEATQAAGPFAGAGSHEQSKGSLLRHPHLLAFIGRNYLPDAQGRWYFQNGPQRVYVELQSAPWILRVDSAAQHFATSTHTGVHVEAQFAVSDEAGHVYLATDAGLGLVHTIDMLHLAEALDTGHWRMVQCEAAKLPGRFGFVRSPWQDASTP